MKAIDKIGLKLWRLITLGNYVPFNGGYTNLVTRTTGKAFEMHFLTFDHMGSKAIETHTSPHKAQLEERWHTKYYTAKQGYKPDLSE